MLKKYISKFTIDILPSILATIVGAYIVNHYIIPKATPDRPAAAASAVPESKAPDNKAASATKPAETSSDIADAPDPAPAKPRLTDKPTVEKASIDKSDAAASPNRHQPTREKAVAKVTPAPVTPAAVAPALATVGTAPANDGGADERRDVNGLARAAIERLNRSEPRQEAVRAPEAPRPAETPRVQEAVRTVPGPAMQQLPPPIVVATPSIENPNVGSQPSYPQADRSDSRRMRPPGEIPAPLPMDLQANAAAASRPERTNVAEDVLSAAKSVFNSVIPHPFER